MKKILLIIFSILILVLFTGCPDPLTPPVDDDNISLTEVSNLQTTYTDGTAMLFYEEPY